MRDPGSTKQLTSIYNLRAEAPFTDSLGPKFAVSPMWFELGEIMTDQTA